MNYLERKHARYVKLLRRCPATREGDVVAREAIRRIGRIYHALRA